MIDEETEIVEFQILKDSRNMVLKDMLSADLEKTGCANSKMYQAFTLPSLLILSDVVVSLASKHKAHPRIRKISCCLVQLRMTSLMIILQVLHFLCMYLPIKSRINFLSTWNKFQSKMQQT